MGKMKESQDKLDELILSLEMLLKTIREREYDFGLAWTDEDKLWQVKNRIEEVLREI